jgi:hypothetical protein
MMAPRFARFNGGPRDGATLELDPRDAAIEFSIPGVAGSYVRLSVDGANYEFAWLAD